MDRCGNYFVEDIDKLGAGGFGEVYKAKVYNLNKTHCSFYARKYFCPSSINNVTFVREFADLRERFLLEIKTQCRLNSFGHSFIAPIVLFNNKVEKPYFVMEMAESNLREAISRGMSESEKIQAVRHIIQGVALIHKEDYLHRDLKPENILKYSNGSYKISDFGLVKDLDTLRVEVETRFDPNGIGSEGYRAPEITDSGIFSCQSDIYALGKIIRNIYEGSSDEKIRPIIKKCTAEFAEDRYKSTLDLMKEFKVYSENTLVDYV